MNRDLNETPDTQIAGVSRVELESPEPAQHYFDKI